MRNLASDEVRHHVSFLAGAASIAAAIALLVASGRQLTSTRYRTRAREPRVPRLGMPVVPGPRTTPTPDSAGHPTVRIAIVGDYRPDHETHPATTASVGHAADRHGREAEAVWLPTPDLDGRAAEVLADCDGIWVAPGSPYASMQGALDAITFARTTGVPLLGTCAGFQHIVLEVARNVCGFHDGAHAESEPDASALIVTPLACSLVGQTFTVRPVAGSRAAIAYGGEEAEERYYCSFGLNPDYVEPLEAAGLRVSGVDQDGEARIVEMGNHGPGGPEITGTLFVPQMRSEPGRPHPLIASFVRSAIHRADGRAARSPAAAPGS